MLSEITEFFMYLPLACLPKEEKNDVYQEFQELTRGRRESTEKIECALLDLVPDYMGCKVSIHVFI